MALDFERGSREKPRGHALLYIRDSNDAAKVYATYIVVLPVNVDIVKYIPPFLSGQVAHMGATEVSSFAFPPVPEEVKSEELPRHLAELREDDLLYGGEANPSDVTGLLERVNSIVQEYAEAWTRYQERFPMREEAPAEISVDAVLYSLMGDRDRLGELSRLVSQLRYASERGYEDAVRETEEKVRKLASYFPESYRVLQLLVAGKDPSSKGARLAQLYLERCYKLLEGDYAGLEQLESDIRAREAAP